MTDKVCVAAGCDGTARGGSHVCIRHWKMLDSDTRAEVFDLKSQARDRVISYPEMERLLRGAFARHFPVRPWPEFPALQAMTCPACGCRYVEASDYHGNTVEMTECHTGQHAVIGGLAFLHYLPDPPYTRFAVHYCCEERGNGCHAGSCQCGGCQA